ncbi:integrase arm-type DNA-binding domain-containing protein [Bradyrhizobium sp. dw_411]|uniref:tyrosine-type recombinase/integrase n=1 Tax=Bradyrhizobium sp. dw_411 TaxID=2720082 RepID=UPI00201C15C0|nr:integrase arm-type DNA-binding domain-containing protein [Bradyrhizobium sp. dw_411]
MPAAMPVEIVRIPQRFTDAYIRRLKLGADESDRIEWDPEMPGFGVRLRSTKAVYVVQYRFQKATQRESLGDVRRLNLDEARKVARQFFAKLELGIDPRAEKRKSDEAAEAAKLTFKTVVDLYLKAKETKMRPNTYRAAEVYFNVKWSPLHRKPIGTIDRKAVAEQMRRIVSEHGATSAARARSNLSALFAWAMKEGMVDANPVVGTNNPIEGQQARDRVLTDEELRIIWRNCLDDDFGRIVRLLLLTACRRDEIGWLRWPEVDLSGSRLLLPAERTKPGRALQMPLVPTARAILEGAPRRLGRQYVFGGSGGGFGAWSWCKLAIDGRIAAAEGRALPHWTLHDLRRTVRTGMSKIGVQPHVAELVLNHVAHRSGVVGVYDHHDYQPEIANALAKWEAHLLEIVAKAPSP